MAVTTLHVEGLTCGNCVKHLTEELTALPGVDQVSVDLVPQGVSSATVTADRPLGAQEVAGAVEEAGYTLVSVS